MRRSFRADSAACTWAKRIISTLAGAGPCAQSTVHEGPHGDLAHVESLPAAHDDLVARRASLEHVQRVRRGDAQTAPLADRETPVAIMLAEPTRLLSISYAVFCLKKKKN